MPGLPHIYFLFTVRLRIFHVCCNENFRNNYLSFYWKKWFYIWYMALAVNLERGDTAQVTMPKPYIKYKIISSSRSWDICYESVNGRTRWLQYSPLSMSGGIIWYMALAWWLVPYLPFPGLPHIYFLFTVRLTNERVGVFLARRSAQHLVCS
jgi:hypothetical protein